MNEQVPSPGGKGGLVSRRGMLDWLRRTAIGAGVTAALPHRLLAAPGYEHLSVDPRDQRYFDSLFSDAAALADFRENPTMANIGKVMRVLARTRTTWTDVIRREVGRLHSGAQVLRNAEGTPAGNGTLLRIRDTRGGAARNSYRYVVVTAWHVAEHVPAPEGSRWVRHPGNADVAVREVSAEESEEWTGEPHALELDMTPRRANDDVGGKVGVVLGRDNDHGPMVRKIYPSLISPRVTRKFLNATGNTDAVIDEFLSQHDEMRLIVLPPEEMHIVNGNLAAKGMSGGAYVYVPEGATSVELGGIFIAVSGVDVDGATYLAGHVADHFQIRETIDELFRTRVPRPELRAKR